MVAVSLGVFTGGGRGGAGVVAWQKLYNEGSGIRLRNKIKHRGIKIEA